MTDGCITEDVSRMDGSTAYRSPVGNRDPSLATLNGFGDWGRLCDGEGGRDDGDDGEDVAERGLHVFRLWSYGTRERKGRVGRAR